MHVLRIGIFVEIRAKASMSATGMITIISWSFARPPAPYVLLNARPQVTLLSVLSDYKSFSIDQTWAEASTS